MIDSSTIIATIVILLFSGFFSGMEIAFVSSSKLRFEMDREEQGFSARLIDTFYRHPNSFISTLLVGNNIALSLGMVGALSIVRFRTAIKDSRDTLYIFWTVIVGICCGVGDYLVAAIGSAITFVVLLIFGLIKRTTACSLSFAPQEAVRRPFRRICSRCSSARRSCA